MLNIVPLSRKYLEETTQMANGVFPYDRDVEHNPERSFRNALQYEEEPKLFEKSPLQKLSYWIVLGDDTNEVIGVTGLYRRNDPDDLVWLAWYCVRADQRGKGIGRKLLEWTIDKARTEEYKRLKLYTSTDPNEARAQELYEKLGFKIVGEEANEHGEKTLYRGRLCETISDMKTILVDAVDCFVSDTGEIFGEMRDLLETYPNKKIILTGANDEQFKIFGLDKMPYEVFTLKHNPEKTDQKYYEAMLTHFNLTKEDVVYFEHNPEAVKSAQSAGIKTYFYDNDKKDLDGLKKFLDENL